MKYLMLSLLVLIGCSNEKSIENENVVYIIQGLGPLKCKEAIYTNCGLHLIDCANEQGAHADALMCVNNVIMVKQ